MDEREQEPIAEQTSVLQKRIPRDDFLKWAGLLGVSPALIEMVAGRPEAALAAEPHAAAVTTSAAFTPIRPPATPLAVRIPYVSTWQDADNLAGNWPRFWTGDVKAIAGIVRVDGQAYVFCGDPRTGSGVPIAPPVTQTELEVTPTQSRYTLQAGAVTLLVTFLSPVETHDLRRLSVPLSYITVQVRSNDGASHAVSVYVDISGEWAHGDPNALITWKREQAAMASGSLTALTATPASPDVLADDNQYNQYPSWGTSLLATRNAPNVTYQIDQDTVVRGLAASQGRLNNTIDRQMPRAINDRYPAFAFNNDLGSVGGELSAPFTLVLGHMREPAVSYVGKPLAPLWRSYWGSYRSLAAFALDDASAARTRASALDAKVKSDAMAAFPGDAPRGTEYAALCALALRQAFGGTELVRSPSGKPWMFLKEISSDGNVSTVDVVYPGSPAFLYANPLLMSLLLDPIIDNCELPPSQGGWPEQFCIHDIGSHYPNATGHPAGSGSEEDMPVEETANMLIMAAAYMKLTSQSEAAAYATAHYPLFKKWASYLTADNGAGQGHSNALDPLFQNQTDDFSGFIGHSVNLALKGILGVAAAGIIAGFAGQTSDASAYTSTAQTYIGQWATMAQDPSGQHLMLTYTEPAEGNNPATNGTGTWSIKYNAYPDKLLGTRLVPASVLTEEANWYKGQLDPSGYGIALDSRHTVAANTNNGSVNEGQVYTKGDWELWTAAATPDATLRASIVDALYKFANTSPSRVPFTDFYNQSTGTQQGFQARPVIGGLFAILTLTAPRTP